MTTETDSLEALERFRDRPDAFDMVITDQAMPKLYGVKLAEEILKIRPGIPIILISGFANSITLESVQEKGIRDFIMKPLAGPELAQAIRHALDAAPVRTPDSSHFPQFFMLPAGGKARGT